ncbi:hypothetical protein GQ53DRAFT_751505 [Thozetella sp. PMI_491]|nr:hypothetical protein GQ53DRAFT_751505 [Thozetella sp. PMI_491]
MSEHALSIAEATEPLVEHSNAQWISSSQRAADLYSSGSPLWRREDLIDIEQQMAQSYALETFTLRRFDGSGIRVANPMFGVTKPIWKPWVKFQDYWLLVRSTPTGPPDTYHCTYLVDWLDQTVHDYEGLIENTRSVFEGIKGEWDSSATCAAVKSLLHGLLGGDIGGFRSIRVTKILCFGLGAMGRKPPYWWTVDNNSRPEQEREPETSVMESSSLHHAIALTVAAIARAYTSNNSKEVRLLTQDPRYPDETCTMLQEYGFEVVGQGGAAGFAELDDECIVFSPYASAPVNQIIADLARPAVIITEKAEGSNVFNNKGRPWANPDSPRTRRLWQGYTCQSFPLASERVPLGGGLHRLVVYTRDER